MKISVSYLSSFYSKEKTLALINKTSADYIHVDLMDGCFVPKKNFIIKDTLTLLKNHSKPLDIHLMTLDPIIYIKDLKTLEPAYITFHIEATKDIVKTIALIKSNNIKVGLAINPETNVLELIPYLSFIDLVLVMSVNPGAGGQSFLPEVLPKIKYIIDYRAANNLNFLINVDGGINNITIKDLALVDMIVAGSYICKGSIYEERIKLLKESLDLK